MQSHQLQMHLSTGRVAPVRNLKLDDYLPYLVNRVGAALVARFTDETLARHGLTIDMWRLLAALANRGGTRQIDLAGMTSIERSTVSRVVTKLVQQGLVTRIRSRTSNREVVVRLSAKGQALVRSLVPVALDLERIASAGVSSRDMTVAKRMLRRVYANLAQAAD